MGHILALVCPPFLLNLPPPLMLYRNTPFDVSKYPGAGSYRICTVAHLSVGETPLTLLNTHFDDQSDAQRRLGASLILYRAQYEAAMTGGAVFVNGDFNR